MFKITWSIYKSAANTTPAPRSAPEAALIFDAAPLEDAAEAVLDEAEEPEPLLLPEVLEPEDVEPGLELPDPEALPETAVVAEMILVVEESADITMEVASVEFPYTWKY